MPAGSTGTSWERPEAERSRATLPAREDGAYRPADYESAFSPHKPMMPAAGLWLAALISMALIGALAMVPKPAAAAMPPALYRFGLPAAAGAVSVTVSSADVSPDPQDGQVLRL